MMESVKHGSLLLLRNNGKSKFYKSMKSLFYQHSGCSVSRSRTCYASCMFRDCDAVLGGASQASVSLFPK